PHEQPDARVEPLRTQAVATPVRRRGLLLGALVHDWPGETIVAGGGLFHADSRPPSGRGTAPRWGAGRDCPPEPLCVHYDGRGPIRAAPAPDAGAALCSTVGAVAGSTWWGSALDDRGDALAAGGADGDERAARPLLLQQLGGGGQDAAAGRGERVAGRQRGAVDVELGPVDRALGLVQAEALGAVLVGFPPGERGQDLRGEGLVDLVEVEVLQGEPVALEQPRHRVGGKIGRAHV